ncbi:hypothetical protein FKP32DRAFT_41737 [Trametes sanguinea]|nr:hypothetical protein FKP32DRAFT_41737 [Trametes sanguinea]
MIRNGAQHLRTDARPRSWRPASHASSGVIASCVESTASVHTRQRRHLIDSELLDVTTSRRPHGHDSAVAAVDVSHTEIPVRLPTLFASLRRSATRMQEDMLSPSRRGVSRTRAPGPTSARSVRRRVRKTSLHDTKRRATSPHGRTPALMSPRLACKLQGHSILRGVYNTCVPPILVFQLSDGTDETGSPRDSMHTNARSRRSTSVTPISPLG